jgi:hypothetical protein
MTTPDPTLKRKARGRLHPTPSRKLPPSATSREAASNQTQAEAQLASFIEKFEPQFADLIRDCRQVLRSILPTAIELVYDNYNFFVIGYCSSEKASDCIVSIAAAATGVSLSFYFGAALTDPARILEGGGKQSRFIRLPTADKLREPEVLALIHAAAAYGKTKLPGADPGYLVIKSVSARQKPRQRARSLARPPGCGEPGRLP